MPNPLQPALWKDYRPRIYGIEVQVDPQQGSSKTGNIVVSTKPLIVEYLKHQITDDGSGTLTFTQDGLYRIDWSISEVTSFWSGIAPMADYYGSVRHGRWRPFSPPLEIGVQLTINVKVINVVARSNPFKVQVDLEGYEDWRTPEQKQMAQR